MKRNLSTKILKIATYVVVLILLYVLQSTPGLFSLFGVKPMLVVPAAVCIAMAEGEFTGGLLGAFAGLLCDLGSSLLFGFNGILLMICCTAVGLVVIYIMRMTIWGSVLLTGGVLLIRGLLDFFFQFGLWGYTGSWKLLFESTLPTILYTMIVTPLLYWLILWIHKTYQRQLKD